MYTNEIEKELKDIENFIGVYPSDMLKDNGKRPALFIVNTHRATEKGEHWQAIALNSDQSGYFFDSFGFPCMEEGIQKFMAKTCKSFIYNSVTLQHPYSNACGKYCIDFVKKLSAGWSYEQFLNQYSRCLKSNDNKIEKIYKHLTKRK